MSESYGKGKIRDYSFTQNRELSWLKFNLRVLEEAMDETVPIFERLKFISIFTSNLDEFFMVRVGSLFDLNEISPDDIDNKTGQTPLKQLSEIFNQVPNLMAIKDKTYSDVCAELEQSGVCDVTYEQLNENERRIVDNYFEAIISPVLSPQIIDPQHPFPHLKNKQLYAAAVIAGKKDKKSLGIIVKNGVIFVLIMAVFFLITLFPLLKNIIASNFANAYSYYMIGGFPQELINQLGHVGYITFVIMIIGLLYGVINKKYRACTLMFIFEYFITIFIFTRIQNMGLHHSLLLLPAYLYFICMFVLLVIKSKFLLVLTILMFIINFMFGVFYQESKVFTDVKLKVPQQKDYLYIKEVCDWLNDNLGENSRAYMITHNNMYNPDKFRNFYMPDKTISKYLPYGSAILGTHKFPVELFDTKYVITTYPFENVSIENVYNGVFNELVGEGKFKLVKTFDMHNGYSVLIYRRIEKVDYDEVMMYENALEGITKDYSNLYKQVIEVYLNENKLVK